MNNDIILEIIENEVESGFVDFKKELYNFSNKKCKQDFIVDIMSFANSHLAVDKYIVAGVELMKNGNRDICGINEAYIEDGANYQSLISDNIEPTINVDFNIIDYDKEDEKLKIVVFKIGKENNDPPYLLSKDYGDLKKGFGKVRKGQRNDYMTRRDIDEYYRKKVGNELSSICLKTLYDNQIDDCAHYDRFINPINYEKALSSISSLIESVNKLELKKSVDSPYAFGNKISIDENDIKTVEEYAKDNKIKLKDDFFDTGNLKYTQLIPYSSGSFSGSDSEKEKYELLSELFDMLNFYNGANDYFTKLSNYYNLSIIIENDGKKHDEEIEIILKIEKECFLDFNDLPIPSKSIIGSINKEVDEMLDINQMNGVNEFVSTSFQVPPTKSVSLPSFPFASKSAEEEYESDVDDYKDSIISKADYEYNYDEKYVYIKAELKSIKPNEKIKFPSILIFKKIPDSIEYEIKSKLNPNIKEGIIKTKK